MEREDRIALLHGFLGSPKDWAQVFPTELRFNAIEWTPVLENLEAPADSRWLNSLAHKMNFELSSQAKHLIGYSMGGRIGLHML